MVTRARRTRRLLRWRGYTVDLRLRELRRLIFGDTPLFVPFDSEQGEILLRRYNKEKQERWPRRR